MCCLAPPVTVGKAYVFHSVSRETTPLVYYFTFIDPITRSTGTDYVGSVFVLAWVLHRVAQSSPRNAATLCCLPSL